MTDPVAELLDLAHEADVVLEPTQLEWLERMRAEYGADVHFELYTLPKPE